MGKSKQTKIRRDKKKDQMQKLIIYRSDQQGVKLLILTNQTNYFMKYKIVKLPMKKQ